MILENLFPIALKNYKNRVAGEKMQYGEVLGTKRWGEMVPATERKTPALAKQKISPCRSGNKVWRLGTLPLSPDHRLWLHISPTIQKD
jgi:hypothetical protein